MFQAIAVSFLQFWDRFNILQGLDLCLQSLKRLHFGFRRFCLFLQLFKLGGAPVGGGRLLPGWTLIGKEELMDRQPEDSVTLEAADKNGTL